MRLLITMVIFLFLAGFAYSEETGLFVSAELPSKLRLGGTFPISVTVTNLAPETTNIFFTLNMTPLFEKPSYGVFSVDGMRETAPGFFVSGNYSVKGEEKIIFNLKVGADAPLVSYRMNFTTLSSDNVVYVIKP